MSRLETPMHARNQRDVEEGTTEASPVSRASLGRQFIRWLGVMNGALSYCFHFGDYVFDVSGVGIEKAPLPRSLPPQ